MWHFVFVCLISLWPVDAAACLHNRPEPPYIQALWIIYIMRKWSSHKEPLAMFQPCVIQTPTYRLLWCYSSSCFANFMFSTKCFSQQPYRCEIPPQWHHDHITVINNGRYRSLLVLNLSATDILSHTCLPFLGFSFGLSDLSLSSASVALILHLLLDS